MSNIGHNKPPLDPKETIQNNINRKKPILDRDPQFFKDLPIPSWIELSLIDVCNRSCSFCPKSNDEIAPNTYQKMERPLIVKLVKDLRENYGIFCSIVVYPVIPKGLILLRLIPTASHNFDDIQETLEAFSSIRERLVTGVYKKLSESLS